MPAPLIKPKCNPIPCGQVVHFGSPIPCGPGADVPIVGIEASMAPLGCTVDGSNNITGKVFLCKVMEDEVGAVPSFEVVHVALDGTTTQPFTGPWQDCAECADNPVPSGVQTAW